MLDENLPTYRSQYSPDKPFSTVLYFTHNGSEPAPYYLLKRPTPSESRNQYALGLLDVQYASVIYGEVLVTPEWSQPTLSAAEVRANGGSPLAVPAVPSAFSINLYNPDQTIVVKHEKGSWSKDAWEFEIPERSFRLPSSSQIDAEEPQSQFAPKVMFRWKRDGRMSRDMTCYMTGRNLGNKKSKEPDITIALYKAAKNDGAVAMYEPNMNRVDVEDRKGLEVALLLSAEVIRDLYLTPKQNLFNTSGNAPPPIAAAASGARPSRNPTPPAALSGASALGISMSGAINNESPQQSSSTKKPPMSSSAQAQARRDSDAMRQAKEAETKRLQAMVAEEKRMAREREKRDQEEQQRIKEMLEEEERERKKREAEEIERETERLRKEYGVPEPSASSPVGGRGPPSPALPPRPGRGGWFGAPSTRPPPQPARPNSAAPPSTTQATSSQQNGKNGRTKLGGLFAPSPYSGPAGASSSAFFGSSAKSDDEREKKKKAKKKRSVHF